MAKNMKVHELAATLGMTPKDLLALCDVMGVGARSRNSVLIEAQADRLRRRAEREGLIRPVVPDAATPSPPQPPQATGPAMAEREDGRPKARRVREVAEDLGLTWRELRDLGVLMGVGVSSASSWLIPAQEDRLRRRVERDQLGRWRPEALPAEPALQSLELSTSVTVDPSSGPSPKRRGVSSNRARFVRAQGGNGGKESARRVPGGRRPVADLIRLEEDLHLEFKETARVDVRTGEKSEMIEHSVLKTIAGFLNSDGGTLLIGVSDLGVPNGIARDLTTLGKRANVDGFATWLSGRIAETMGGVAASLAVIGFEDCGGVQICRVDVPAHSDVVFLTADKNRSKNERDDETVYVRASNTTRALKTAEVVQFARARHR